MIYDVAVIGAGPAGAATAVKLSSLGYGVLLLERSSFESSRPGETVPGRVRVPLTELGLWEDFQKVKPVLMPAIDLSWGSDELVRQGNLFDPYGSGWQFCRRTFDEALARAAAHRGAQLLLNHQVTDVSMTPDNLWLIDGRHGDGKFSYEARFLVDASGRKSSLTARTCRRVDIYDQMIAITGYVSVGSEHACDTLLIEAVENGWWYSARTAPTQRVASLITDRFILQRTGLPLKQFWLDELRQTRFCQPLLPGAGNTTSLLTRPVQTMATLPTTGKNRLAAGDSAFSIDPLSGQGITNSLESGLASAHAIDKHLRNEDCALQDYEANMHQLYKASTETQKMFYDAETRWRDAPFWAARPA